MAKTLRQVDAVRASRDGHEFHETWAARKALQLLLPDDDLIGIAVEGLSPTDQTHASQKTVEIADLVLYYGTFPTFEDSRKVVILQFKYSISAKDKEFANSDAKKTIHKFAAAYRNHKKNYGRTKVARRLEFQLITNRPILPEFSEAIKSVANRKTAIGKVKRQVDQFRSNCKLRGDDLVQFARKLNIVGLAGNLAENQRNLSRILVDLSLAPDALSRARLGKLKQLIREKAGSAGTQRNVIRRADLLDALELQDEGDLFPCPEAFPPISKIVEPNQLFEIAQQILQLRKPLLIHASGGVGKTVFLQSLSKALAQDHEVVLFDCFGGGAYRAPGDARHLARRGLTHIVNNLACRGLCDPLLPGNAEDVEVIEAFRRRLKAVVSTLRCAFPSKQVLLFLDAIDNAAEYAKERGEGAFPKLLLESIHHGGPIEGMQLIVSCRTHRIELARGEVACEECELKPFTIAQTRSYLAQCLPSVTDTEVKVAHARSEGNPRILAHLVESDRGLLDVSELDNPIKLDDLLTKRINDALSDASKRGYKQSEIDAFLAGLCVLPLPVPLTEYASTQRLDESAIKSFAVDLVPLLEKTTQGLMFRDEPTETLMRSRYGSNVSALRKVASNLLDNQNKSVYAARALPGLLQRLNDGQRLFELAFDERFPETITSAVGKEAIRYARLKAAVFHAAQEPDYGRLVRLLSELSTIAAVNQRGTQYVLENPDLVIVAQDLDAIRRLFETRTAWQGTRHARLAIAHVLSGQFNDAYRHAVRASEWVHHHSMQDERQRRSDGAGPDLLDIAAIPLCLIAHDRVKDAASFLALWKNWYGFEVAEKLFDLVGQLQANNATFSQVAEKVVRSISSETGVVIAALAFLDLSSDDSLHLIGALRQACSSKVTGSEYRFRSDETYTIEDGLLKASVIAVSLGRGSDAIVISSAVVRERPTLSSFGGYFAERDVFRFICPIAIAAAAKAETVVDLKVLPQELFNFCESMPSGTTGTTFRKWLRADVARRFDLKSEVGKSDKAISYDLKDSAERFIDGKLEPIVRLTDALACVISAPMGEAEKDFAAFIDLWIELRDKANSYGGRDERNRFFDRLAQKIALFVLWTRSDLKRQSVELLWKQLKENCPSTPILIQCTATISKRTGLGELAGEIAIRAKQLIEQEADVSVRATYYAQLSRAILAASKAEASVYFRAGLEQMDAIGSGDYEFTNELLLFAAALNGPELEEKDFHTLTNICELNISDEAEKFPWGSDRPELLVQEK